MKLEVNWPTLALLAGLGIGAALNSCYETKTFAQRRTEAEAALAKRLPDILPEGWKIVGTPHCITWCRTMYGSEFDVEVLTDEPAFTKVRISCDTEGDEV